MSELIVAAFDNAHTAFLAGAALSRIQQELSMDRHDVAVVCREEGGDVSVREAVDLAANGELQEPFWKTLAGLIFSPRSTDDTDEPNKASARLTAIGISEACTAAIAKMVQPGNSAVVVLAEENVRDHVIGVLQGFRGKVKRTRLVGQGREEWLSRLSGR